MATAGEIIARASLFSGLVNSGTEATLMLSMLDEVYKRAVEDAEIETGTMTATFTAGSGVSAALTGTDDVIRVTSAYTSNYPGYPKVSLRPISKGQLRRMQEGTDVSGVPRYYSWSSATDDTGVLEVFPSPTAAFTLTLDTISGAQDLDDIADIPTAIPTRYHMPVLSNALIAMCFDREGRHDRADVFWSRYETALTDMTHHANIASGELQMEWFDDTRAVRYAPDQDLR